MNYIDVKNFRKYEQLFGDNGPAKIGHVNAVIKSLNEVAANLPSGGGLTGTNYVFVAADGTDTENAAALQAAYTKAATLVSNISSWTTVGLAGAIDYGNGQYDVYFNPSNDFFQANVLYNIRINGVQYTAVPAYAFPSNAFLVTNAPAGLNINASTLFEVEQVVIKGATVIAAPGYYNFGGSAFVMDQENVNLVSLDGNRSIIFNGGTPNTGALVVTASNVYIKGVDVEEKTIVAEDNSGKNVFENCRALGTFSFGEVNSTGTYINCEGGQQSFGANGNASGTYIDCKGGNSSFGGVYTASGTFTRCTAGLSSFGYLSSGVFTDCVGAGLCFGSSGTASGIFRNCIAGDESFGGGFGIGTASGTFTNCEAGNASFGGGTLSGYLYYCRLTFNTFNTIFGGGVFYCVDGLSQPNNQGFVPQNKL